VGDDPLRRLLIPQVPENTVSISSLLKSSGQLAPSVAMGNFCNILPFIQPVVDSQPLEPE